METKIQAPTLLGKGISWNFREEYGGFALYLPTLHAFRERDVREIRREDYA